MQLEVLCFCFCTQNWFGLIVQNYVLYYKNESVPTVHYFLPITHCFVFASAPKCSAGGDYGGSAYKFQTGPDPRTVYDLRVQKKHKLHELQ